MYKILLCIRYLRTRYIALASIVSVMLGVATMIVVNSVMAGFTNEMRDRIHGFLADIVVESRSMNGIVDARAQMALVQDAAGEYIAAMTPTVEVPGMITYSDPVTGETFTQPVQMIGIDPIGKSSVGPLKDYLGSYNPTIEDGQIIKEAVRSQDVPLCWDLTPGAAEYRKWKKQQDMALLSSHAPVDPLAAGMEDSPIATEEIPEPDFGTPMDDSTDVAVQSPGNLLDPGAPDIDTVFDNTEEPKDPAAPYAARVYLGEQITSYQTRDPETGRIRKVSFVNPGDDIILTTVQADTPPQPISINATVVDVFRSGMSEYDGQLVLMNLDQLQEQRGMIAEDGDAITSIQIKLKDYADADEVERRLKAAFPPGLVTVKTWEDKQGLLLSAVEMETAILNVLLFLIIAVAGFGILAIFFMIVVEKTRDIGILKSLGASSNGVMSIFLSYGLALGIVGSMAGVGIGLLFVHYINQIEDALSWLTGRKVFDEEIYYFSEIPTQVGPMMVFWVAVGAIGIAVLASVLPARRASRLHPVRALRYE